MARDNVDISSVESLALEIERLLRVYPGNLSRVAKELGVSRSKVANIVEEREIMKTIQDEWLDGLEEQLYKHLHSIGVPDVETSTKFPFAQVIKTLDLFRPEIWGKKAAAVRAKESSRLPHGKGNGIADRLLNEYARNQINGTAVCIEELGGGLLSDNDEGGAGEVRSGE